jgi:hypothetical protein
MPSWCLYSQIFLENINGENMKKLIALSLIVVCLGCFSLGCGEAKKPTPAPTPAPAADTTSTDAPAAPADKPK